LEPITRLQGKYPLSNASFSLRKKADREKVERCKGEAELVGPTERRKSPRKEVSWAISIILDYGTVEGEIKNISPEGLMIFCEEPLRLNETYRMSILSAEGEAIGFLGKVVWADAYCMGEDDTAFGMGVCLVELSEEAREHLDKFLSKLP
jgi:hypothetical protein